MVMEGAKRVMLCRCGKVLESPADYAAHCAEAPDHFTKTDDRSLDAIMEAKIATWDTALRCAKNAVEMFPPDTANSLHRFGAETVLRALLHVHKQSLPDHVRGIYTEPEPKP